MLLLLVNCMNAFFVLLFMILGVSSILGFVDVAHAQYSETPSIQDNADIEQNYATIGAILPLTGDASHSGEQLRVAIELANTHFNDYLEENDEDWRLNVTILDSQTDPNEAFNQIKLQHERGTNFIVGPYSSAELAAMKNYADTTADVLIISPSSTAPVLAVEGDNVFRFIPDDTQNGYVFAKLFENAGVTTVIPVWRGDTWGAGLIQITSEAFNKLGGNMESGIRYNADTTDFSDVTAELSTIIKEYDDTEENVAVLVLGFQEVIPLIQSSVLHENLSSVPWFASSGTLLANELINDPDTVGFMRAVNMTGPQFEGTPNPVLDDLNDHVLTHTGNAPIVYVAGAYDAVWVLGLSMLESKSFTDVDTIASTIPSILETYKGALGQISLTPSGDLDLPNYGIYQIHDSDWNRIGGYDGATRTITFVDSSATSYNQITIGGIVPLTNIQSPGGHQLKIAMNYAADKFNQYLEKNTDANWRLKIDVADTQSNSDIALGNIMYHHANDVVAVVGPNTSAELALIMDYATENGMIIVSPSSTAPGLAIPDDNIFRFTPDDTLNGHVFAKLIEASGVETIIPIWRGDVWGDELVDITRESFVMLGGVMDAGVRYDPNTDDFSEHVATLSEIVKDHTDLKDSSKVGVLVFSFREALPLLEAASQHDNLYDVMWFGSVTLSGNDSMMSPEISEFINAIKLASSTLELSPNPVLDDLNQVLSDSTGDRPSLFAPSAYDAVWVLGLSMLESNSFTDADTIASAIPDVLETYNGALGQISLNEAGDLVGANYGIYRFENMEWTSVGMYDGMADTVTLTTMVLDAGDTSKESEKDSSSSGESGGGCLIATAAYGNELAPNVQMLREIRDNTLLSTTSGTSFVTEFNQFYYSFSPAIADLQRENPIFQDAVRVIITPGLYVLGIIMTFADAGSESSIITFGLLSIVMIVGMYLAMPVVAVVYLIRHITCMRYCSTNQALQ